MRPWSQSLTTRHTSASVKPRDAAGLKISTPELRSGQSEKPLSFLWSASVRWCCSEASFLTRRRPLHALDRNSQASGMEFIMVFICSQACVRKVCWNNSVGVIFGHIKLPVDQVCQLYPTVLFLQSLCKSAFSKMLYVFKMCFGQKHPAYFKYLKFLNMYLFYVLPFSTLILSWPLTLVCSL